MRQPLGSLIVACLGLMMVPMVARSERHLPGDLVLVDRKSLVPGTSALLRVRSRSGLAWNDTTRTRLVGGSAFIAGRDGTDLLVRATVPLPDRGPSPSSALLEVQTTQTQETFVATGEVIIGPSISPLVELLAPVTVAGTLHETTEATVRIEGIARPATSLQIQILNMTTGTLVSASVVQDRAGDRVLFNGSVSLVPGQNEILVLATDESCLVCVPGEFFFVCDLTSVPGLLCRAHILHIDRDRLEGTSGIPVRLTGADMLDIQLAKGPEDVKRTLGDKLFPPLETEAESPEERERQDGQLEAIVLPDRPHPSAARPANILRVVLQITPEQFYGSPMFVRIVDPDDPSPNEIVDPNDQDGVNTDAGDPYGLAGDRDTRDNRGFFDRAIGVPLPRRFGELAAQGWRYGVEAPLARSRRLNGIPIGDPGFAGLWRQVYPDAVRSFSPVPLTNSALRVTTDHKGIAIIELAVGLQPGDDYQLHVHCIEKELLEGRPQASSPRLRIWRRLFIEDDIMDVPPPRDRPGSNHLRSIELNYINASAPGSYAVAMFRNPIPADLSRTPGRMQGGLLAFEPALGLAGRFPIGASGPLLLWIS